jgi:thiol-disulfide isomerase/thioredoxin/protocatechuate 3,4-dioxygenase beta subunit
LEPSDSPDALGRLGGYNILEIIGRGGMGVVLKGYDRELKRFVAIKALAPHLAHSPLARKRFAREAQAAAAVVNSHVIAIHQVQPNGRLPFLVMPLLTGESLAQRLKSRGVLELKEVLRIGMQAAEGLAAAHDQGLVHRDVKPANILLEKGIERAVLTDFGLARTADDVSLTRLGVIAGTPEYMSPEQAKGETVDARSDLFSLGCVLYEMATGVSPFRTETPMATLRRIVDESPRSMALLNPELPIWFVAIVERLLAKNPEQRYATARQVCDLLAKCLAHLHQPTTEALPEELTKETALSPKLYWHHLSVNGPQLIWGRVALLALSFTVAVLATMSVMNWAFAMSIRWMLLLFTLLFQYAGIVTLIELERQRALAGHWCFRLGLKSIVIIMALFAGAMVLITTDVQSTLKTIATPPSEFVFPNGAHVDGGDATVFYMRNADRVEFVLFHAGRFNSTTSSTGNKERGDITLENGKTFFFDRQPSDDYLLRINGKEYVLTQGRVLELLNDGSVRQDLLFPTLETVKSPADVKRLIEEHVVMNEKPESLQQLNGQLKFIQAHEKALLEALAETHPLVAENREKQRALQERIMAMNEEPEHVRLQKELEQLRRIEQELSKRLPKTHPALIENLEKQRILLSKGFKSLVEKAEADKRPANPANEENQKPFVVFGQITDESGQPLQGVEVFANCGLGSLVITGNAKTDADGKYRLHFGPGVIVSNKDFPHGVGTQVATITPAKEFWYETNLHRRGNLLMTDSPVPIKAEERKGYAGVVKINKPYELNFVMTPGTTVKGYLLNEFGFPIAGQSLSMSGPELPPECSVFATTETDAQGRFAFTGVPVKLAGQEERLKWRFGLRPFGIRDELFSEPFMIGSDEPEKDRDPIHALNLVSEGDHGGEVSLKLEHKLLTTDQAAKQESPWSEPFFGMRIRMTAPENAVYRHDEPLPLFVELQNVGDAPVRFADLHRYCRIEIDDAPLAGGPRPGDQDQGVIGESATEMRITPWELMEGEIKPQQSLSWVVHFERMRLHKPTTRKSVNVTISIPRQLQEPGKLPSTVYSWPVTIALQDQPLTVGNNRLSDSMPRMKNTWTSGVHGMDITYREHGGLIGPSRAMHIDSNGQVTLVEYETRKLKSRKTTQLTQDKLDQLALSLKKSRFWEGKSGGPPLIDLPEVQFCVAYGGASFVGGYYVPPHAPEAYRAFHELMQTIIKESQEQISMLDKNTSSGQDKKPADPKDTKAKAASAKEEATKQDAAKNPWSETFMGLRIRLTAPKDATYQHDQQLPLAVELQNADVLGAENDSLFISAIEEQDANKRSAFIKGEYVTWSESPARTSGRLDSTGRGTLTQPGTSGGLIIIVPNQNSELVVEPGFDNSHVVSSEQVPNSNTTKMIDEAGRVATVSNAKVSLSDGVPLLTFQTKPTSAMTTKTLTGRVVDHHDKPLSGAKVSAEAIERDSSHSPLPDTTTTDDAGCFRLAVSVDAQPERDLKLSVIITKDGCSGANTEMRDLIVNVNELDFGTTKLAKGYTLPVRVVSQDGKPIAGASIETSSTSHLLTQAVRSDASGRAILRNLPAGVVPAQISFGGIAMSTKLIISSDDQENTEIKVTLADSTAANIGSAKRPDLLAVGKQAPDWDVEGWSDGTNRRIADYRGNVLVIEFWGMWCGPCVKAIPWMQRLAETCDREAVVFLGIHTPDGDFDQIARLKKLLGWSAPIAIDRGTSTSDGVTSSRFGIHGYPTILIINREGKVAFNSSIQPTDMEAFMQEMSDIAQSIDTDWPLNDRASPEEIEATMNKIHHVRIRREIDRILETTR